MPCWRSSAPAFTRWCRAVDRSARAAIWRRWPISRWCSSARARRSVEAGGFLARRPSRGPACRRLCWARKKGWRSSTARRRRRPCWLWRWWAPSDSPVPPISAAALSIDALRGSSKPFDARIHAARPHAGQAISADNLAAAHGRKCHQCLACRLRARAGRVLRALRGPGARRGTGRARVCAPDGRNRGKRVHGQPDGLRRAGRDRLGRQLPWRAGGHRGGSDRHRRRAVRDDQRAAVRAAGQPRAQRPARLPHRAWGTRVGTDAGPGDGGRASPRN